MSSTEYSSEEYQGFTIEIHYDTDAEDPRIWFDFWDDEQVQHWIDGEVYGFVVKDEWGEFIDSCWGYYEDPDGFPLEEARRQVDYALAARIEGLQRLADAVPDTLR